MELVWEASEEGEEMLEFSSERLDTTEAWIRELARSSSADIRWQVYETLRNGVGKPWAEGILRSGLVDADPYARRRASLALAPYKVADVADIVKTLVREHDPYLRQAAVVLAAESSDLTLVQKTRSVLIHDPAQQVRDAVAQLLKLRPDGA
jgi:HEAT repeat protein